MTWNLNEPFDSAFGSWQDFAPTDATMASDDFEGTWLFGQNHIDVRNFRVLAGTVAVPQTDLEAVAQTVLDGETQTAMEQKPGAAIASENWALTSTTGTHNDLVVGEIAARGGWSGAQFHTNGSAVNAQLTSVITHPVDLTLIGTADLSIIFPDYTADDFDQASSYVQLCSGGAFGGGHDSLQVLFSANQDGGTDLALLLSAFDTAGFDPTAVTGVRLQLVKASAPANNTLVTVMAIRVITDTYNLWLDFDTLLGAVAIPVSFDGTAPTGTLAKDFQFVRGDQSADDPIPADVAMNMYFYPGGNTSPPDDDPGDDNQIGFIMREKRTGDDSTGVGSHLEASLFWSDTETIFQVRRVDTSGGSPGTPTYSGEWDTSDHGTPIGVLNPNQNYVFHVELVGTSVQAAIYEVDLHHNQGALFWQLETTLSNPAYIYRNGRVGWILSLVNRDAYVDDISVSPQGFATLESEIFMSHTPVDGAQLAGIFSTDINLWDTYTGADLLIDQTKSLSGTGSYRSALGITTNTFIVDDWTEMYFDFQIFVPATVTKANQPVVVLNTSDGPEQIIIKKLQPAQWNFVHCDLTNFQNLINGVGYSISINAASSPDKPLGNYWVDETVIGRRRVRWSIRATENGTYREFKDMINNPAGAVHLNTEERGTALQVKAVALTQDAWVGSFKLFPHYAQLGNMLYDPVFFAGSFRDD